MRAALVTGAGRRLGAEMAKALARDGWHVWLHYNRSAADTQELLESLHDEGLAAAAIMADLADPLQLKALVTHCAGNGPPLTCLVNNASIFSYDRIDSLEAETLDRHMAVNLRAPALLCRAFAEALPKDLEAAETGCIVNMLDNKLVVMNPDYLSYTLSKVALGGLTQALALDLAPRIRVCGIAPGIVLPNEDHETEEFEKVRDNNPLGRGCRPEDIVGTLRFILTTPCITGQMLVLDGGRSLAGQPRDIVFLDNG